MEASMAAERKIENESEKRAAEPAKQQRYEVVVSFAPFDKGEVFTADQDQWADQHEQAGYLRRIDGDEPGREVPDGERSQVSPR